MRGATGASWRQANAPRVVSRGASNGRTSGDKRVSCGTTKFTQQVLRCIGDGDDGYNDIGYDGDDDDIGYDGDDDNDDDDDDDDDNGDIIYR